MEGGNGVLLTRSVPVRPFSVFGYGVFAIVVLLCAVSCNVPHQGEGVSICCDSFGLGAVQASAVRIAFLRSGRRFSKPKLPQVVHFTSLKWSHQFPFFLLLTSSI